MQTTIERNCAVKGCDGVHEILVEVEHEPADREVGIMSEYWKAYADVISSCGACGALPVGNELTQDEEYDIISGYRDGRADDYDEPDDYDIW